MSNYIFDQAWEKERERLAGLESVWDPSSIRSLEIIGVARGWQCLEVGAGAGSITRWLAERVGDSGLVLATDLDVRFLTALPNVEIRTHDVVSDELPERAFDLVHARCLLEHLPARRDVLKKLATTLKPGGWLLIEDLDWTNPLYVPTEQFFSEPASARAVWQKAVLALASVMSAAGIDLEFGRELPGYMRSEGLMNVCGEVRVPFVTGDSPGTRFLRWTFEQLREALVSSGQLAAEEIDGVLSLLDDPEFLTAPGALTSVWGQAG